MKFNPYQIDWKFIFIGSVFLTLFIAGYMLISGDLSLGPWPLIIAFCFFPIAGIIMSFGNSKKYFVKSNNEKIKKALSILYTVNRSHIPYKNTWEYCLNRIEEFIEEEE